MGHRIFGDGVSVDQDKISTIRNRPIPDSIKSLRGFLGLTGYYQHFVSYYASIAASLIELLRKNAFVWSLVLTTSFQQLKRALMNALVLVLPNFNIPFIVQTDALGSGVGAVLPQGKHPIAYFSKQLST